MNANPGDLVVDALAANEGPWAFGTGQTQRWNQVTGLTAFDFTGAGSDKPASSPVTMTWSTANMVYWALIGVDLQPPTIIPEYPYGLPLLATFMVIGYGLIRRKTRN